MAFRSAGTPASVALLSGGMTLGSPPGYQVNELLLAFLSEDRAAVDAANITFAGWTLCAEFQHGADGQNLLLYGRKATGSDNFSLSTTSTSAQTVGVAVAWSGRDADAFLASPATYLQSFTNGSSGTPYAITATGVTASGGDDIAALIGLDQFAATDTWTFSDIAFYTKRVDYQPGNTASITVQTRDNVSAGATGNLTLTATRTAGAANANAGGWVLRLPAGATDTTAPVLSSPAHSGVGSTSATVGATTDEGNGTAYVVATLTSTAPTVAQIKAGQDAAGASVPAGRQRTVAISATGAFTFTALASLASSTQHWYHVVHTDAAGNNSNVVTGTFTTSAANTPPSWTGTPSNMTAKRGQAFTAQNITSLVTDSDTLTYSLTGAPAGVTIDSSTGIISGTANVAPGTFTCTVGANDGVNSTVSSASFTITVTACSLDISAKKLGGFVGGTVGSFAIDAAVSYTAEVYTVGGALNGAHVFTQAAANTDANGVLASPSNGALVFGTSYEVVFVRQTDNRKTIIRRTAA